MERRIDDQGCALLIICPSSYLSRCCELVTSVEMIYNNVRHDYLWVQGKICCKPGSTLDRQVCFILPIFACVPLQLYCCYAMVTIKWAIQMRLLVSGE